MKYLVLLTACLLGSHSFAVDGFPVGKYSGSGVKRYEDGRTTKYDVEMTVAKAHIDFVYRFPSLKDPVTFSLDMTFGREGFFKIGDLGDGYCGETACHWSVTLAPNVTEQWTLVFHGDELFKTGSLASPKSRNWWEERLRKL